MKRIRFTNTVNHIKNLDVFIEAPEEDRQFAAVALPHAGLVMQGALIPIRGWVCLSKQVASDVYFDRPDGSRVATVTGFFRRLDLDDLATARGIAHLYDLLGFECILPAFLFWGGELILKVRPKPQSSGHPVVTLRCEVEDIPWPEAPGGALFPVMVSSLGRSGSSLLHALIATHPLAVGERSYPRECKYAQAVMTESLGIQLAGGLCRPDLGADSPANPYFENQLRLSSVLQNGLANYDFLFSDMWESRRRFALDMTDQIYRRFFAERAASARFFVEKGSNVYSSVLSQYFYQTVRDIVLIRDPRDLAASAVAYNKSGAPADFAEFNQDFEAAVRTMGTQLRVLHEAQAYKASMGCLVRYEDLITDMPGTVARIFAHIGFPLEPPELEATLATAMAELGTSYDRHRTSGTAADRSIGRWKRDLDDSQKAICAVHTGWFTAIYYPGEAD